MFEKYDGNIKVLLLKNWRSFEKTLKKIWVKSIKILV